MVRLRDRRHELGIDIEEFKKKEFYIMHSGRIIEEVCGDFLWSSPFCQISYEIGEDESIYYNLHDYTHQLLKADKLKIGESMYLVHLKEISMIHRVK